MVLGSGGVRRHSEVRMSLVTSNLVAGVMTLQTITSQVSQLGRIGPTSVGVGVLLALVCAGSFLFLQRAVERGALRVHRKLVSAVTLVTALGLMAFSGWALIGLAVAAILLAVPSRVGTVITAILLAVIFLVVMYSSDDPLAFMVIPTVAALVGLVLYALTRLAETLVQLHAAREHLARMYVSAERSRISRDLHDIMGRTLVTASLRNEAALRLLETEPRQALKHLKHVQEVLGDSQSQLRALTSGPVLVGFDEELESAADLCARLRIDFSVAVSPGLPSPELEMLCSAVLREGITNMLKHSRPRRCWLALRQESHEVVLSLVNDGCTSEYGGTNGKRGTGLESLGSSLADRHGSLQAHAVPPDRFVVLMRVAADAEETARPEVAQCVS